MHKDTPLLQGGISCTGLRELQAKPNYGIFREVYTVVFTAHRRQEATTCTAILKVGPGETWTERELLLNTPSLGPDGILSTVPSKIICMITSSPCARSTMGNDSNWHYILRKESSSKVILHSEKPSGTQRFLKSAPDLTPRAKDHICKRLGVEVPLEATDFEGVPNATARAP